MCASWITYYSFSTISSITTKMLTSYRYRYINPVNVSSFILIYFLCLHGVTCDISDKNHLQKPKTTTFIKSEIEKDSLIPVSESEYLHHTDYEGSGTSEDTKSEMVILGDKIKDGIEPNKIHSHGYSKNPITATDTSPAITIEDSPNKKDLLQGNGDLSDKQAIVVLQQTPPGVIVVLVLFIILLICASIIIGYLVIKLKRMRRKLATPIKQNGAVADDDEYSVMMEWGTD